MALLADVKSVLRVNGTASDTEIQALIDAAKKELTESGVLSVSESDALTKIAIQEYCKAQFGYDNSESSRFMNNFNDLKVKLAIAQTYSAFTVTFTVKDGDTPIRDAYVYITNEDIGYYTNSLGVAVHKVYEITDVDYTVSKSGYDTVTDSVYVAANAAESVAL